MTEERGAEFGLSQGSVVTVGTFDGVHRGHRAVLEEIRVRAETAGLKSVLVTFDPHPLAVVRPELAPRLLSTPREKREVLAASGIDVAVFLRFTEALSRYSPARFVEEILVRRLNVKELVIGYDHGFGRGREGDAETLRSLGVDWGFTVDVVAPVSVDGGAVSSTEVRRAVTGGEVAGARAALGRPYSLVGRVEPGDGRGRGLGFPTANLGAVPDEKLVPPHGVYAVRANLPSGVHAGALHIGPRPTFPDARPSIELHVLDFEGDLYGRWARVDFIERIRGIVAFGSVDALVERMGLDVARVRELFAGPESG